MEYSKDFLLSVHEKMLTLRTMELKILDTYAKGTVPGHIHSAIGQEGSFVGVLSNKVDGDYWKPVHRMTSLPYMMGMDEDMFWGELFGKKTGNSGGRGGMLHIGDFDTGYIGFSATLGNDAGIIGAAFVVVVDTLARSMSAAEIPISVLTAIIGAPFFISLLRSSGRYRYEA